MAIFKKYRGKWYEYKYLDQNGIDAVKNGYSFEANGKNKSWKDRKDNLYKVKLTRINT